MCYLQNLFKITIFSKFLKEESEIWIQKDFGHMARRRGNKKGHNIIIIATPCNPSLPPPTPPPLAALSPLPVKHTLSLVYHGNHSICPKQTQRHSCTEIKTTCLIKGSTIVDSHCMVLIQQCREKPSWWNFLRTKIYCVKIHLIFICHVYNKCAKYTLFCAPKILS